MWKNIKYCWLLLTCLLVLAACGTGGGYQVKPDSDTSKLRGLSLYAAQDYFAASQWLSESRQQNPNDTEVYVALLDTWLQLGEVTRVWQLLNEVEQQPAEARIIQAELAQYDQQCDVAVDRTDDLDAALLSMPWQQRFWQLRASCLSALQQHLAAAVATVNLTALETDDFLLQTQQDEIVKNLIQVDESALILALGSADYDELTQGWIEAAYVNFGADGISGSGWLQQWPEHPAAKYFLDLNQVNQRQKVAVLLPFSGRFNAVAKAVQKGMLAAALADESGQNELLFFDTGSGGENLAAAWYSAQENQADLIIGPLDKASIEAAELMPSATVPVVLLNQSESEYLQFTLSPEREAQEVADRMIADGHKRVLIMAPNEPWGERLTVAFAQRFVDLGGQISNNSYFQPEQNDYSAQLRQMLGLVESQLRARNLQQFLKINLDAEEVVSADIDAIFLASRPAFARLMVPQLKFHRAGAIPVYATSHVFDGLNNAQHNKDLEGLTFAISPMELQTERLLEILPFDIHQVEGDRKLFAFGFDAYQLIARLEWMNRVNTGLIDGLSGKISMGFDGIFRRQLAWAQYNNGLVNSLPN